MVQWAFRSHNKAVIQKGSKMEVWKLILILWFIVGGLLMINHYNKNK